MTGNDHSVFIDYEIKGSLSFILDKDGTCTHQVPRPLHQRM